jgi:hypothetical protein
LFDLLLLEDLAFSFGAFLEPSFGQGTSGKVFMISTIYSGNTSRTLKENA